MREIDGKSMNGVHCPFQIRPKVASVPLLTSHLEEGPVVHPTTPSNLLPSFHLPPIKPFEREKKGTAKRPPPSSRSGVVNSSSFILNVHQSTELDELVAATMLACSPKPSVHQRSATQCNVPTCVPPSKHHSLPLPSPRVPPPSPSAVPPPCSLAHGLRRFAHIPAQHFGPTGPRAPPGPTGRDFKRSECVSPLLPVFLCSPACSPTLVPPPKKKLPPPNVLCTVSGGSDEARALLCLQYCCLSAVDVCRC